MKRLQFWISAARWVKTMALLAACTAMTCEVAVAEELTAKAQAAKAVAEALIKQKATWKGPMSSPKPFANKKLAVISCCQAAEGAARPARAIVEAGKLLGWTVDVFDGKGDPQEQNKALNAAVDAKYDGIALVFTDTTTVSDGVKRALDAKIPLITLGSLHNTPETIPDVSHDWIAHGQAIADYMIWKSNGKVNALLLKNTDLYITEHGQYKGTFDVLSDKSKCDDCKFVTKDWALANLDTQPGEIAQASVQADPTINWVWCFDACMSRVARTLAANGTGQNVKGAGFDCNGENVQLIKDGIVQMVSACDPRDWEAYALVDNVNRMMHGQPAVQQNIPIKMIDVDTVGQLSDNEIKNGWQGDVDFRAEYKKLWGVN